MKKGLLAFGFIALVLFVNGCKTDVPEQKYDMLEYIVSSDAYSRCQAQAQSLFGDNEPTEQDLNQMEQWIVSNASPQLYIARDLTRDQITDALLKVTSISRDKINSLFEKIDSIGKYLSIFTRTDGKYDILVIDKI